MIAGTIRNAVNQMQMMNQWENKKTNGKILQHEKKKEEMTAEESMLQDFKEQLQANRENEGYSRIYYKLMSGQELSREELEKLKEKNPKAYMEYLSDRMEQKAYERRLRNCRTKEEAERLHVNKMNGKLSELKSVVNNPNIPESEKLATAQRILGDTKRTTLVYQHFVKSAEFKKLPTEEELMEAQKTEQEAYEVQNLPDNPEKEDTVDKTSKENQNDNPAPIETKDTNTDIASTHVTQSEKQILEEISEIEKKYVKTLKNDVRIDLVL